MIKKRLIPKLLVKKKQSGTLCRSVLVTTKKFGIHREVGDPISQAKIYEAQMADELMILNIDGPDFLLSPINLKMIESLAMQTFMPLTIGGGIRNVNDFEILLAHGADKISINSEALVRPQIITEASRIFGSQCVVVAIDFKENEQNQFEVYLNNGRTKSEYNLMSWVKKATDLGAGELVLTDIDKDGSGMGLNIDICRKIADTVSVPVVLSGGCGLSQHFIDGFKIGKAEGIAAGTFFSLRDQNPIQTRAHIANAGVLIRKET